VVKGAHGTLLTRNPPKKKKKTPPPKKKPNQNMFRQCANHWKKAGTAQREKGAKLKGMEGCRALRGSLTVYPGEKNKAQAFRKGRKEKKAVHFGGRCTFTYQEEA